MMTSSNGNIFRVTGHLCGEFIAHRRIPRPKASDAELLCFLWHLNKWLSKQSWGWWFETPSRPLCRHSNVTCHQTYYISRTLAGNKIIFVCQRCSNYIFIVYLKHMASIECAKISSSLDDKKIEICDLGRLILDLWQWPLHNNNLQLSAPSHMTVFN